MRSARDEILWRIREALGAGEGGSPGGRRRGDQRLPSAVPRNYRRKGTAGPVEILGLLQARIVDYEAVVVRCRPPELPEVISGRLGARGVNRLVIPSNLPHTWLKETSPLGLEISRDLDPQALSHAQLDSAHAVLTGCALAIAETGTLVLDGGRSQGRRALSLVPDFHLCVVSEDQVVETVPEAIEILMESVSESPRPLTFISGPSATSDIELIRVEGVHGPRTLDVILVEDP